MDNIPMENKDLLSENNPNTSKTESNGKLTRDSIVRDPPDGGFRAYTVIIGSFLTNGLLFGVINSYSVIFTELKDQLNKDHVANSDSKAALVGALTLGTTFLLSPLSGILTAVIGLRCTAVLGGSIAAASLLISSFVVHHVDALCFTYGIMYGLGASLAYTPSLAILGHYFKRYLGLVNGIVTIGSSVFTVIIPPLMDFAIKRYGLDGLFRILSVITVGIALCGLLFKPIPVVVIENSSRENSGFKALVKAIVNVEIWKNKKYKMWALSMPIALFGYFVPYVHIHQYVVDNFKDVEHNLPLQSIGIASGVGRLVFGYLADKKGINKIFMQQISFYIIGCLTILVPFVESFPLLITMLLCMGLFDGAFIALIGPIAIQLCGSKNAAQAIGCMLGLAATPISLGPPIAAYIKSLRGSYTLPFILAGFSPIVGASIMFAIRFQKNR